MKKICHFLTILFFLQSHIHGSLQLPPLPPQHDQSFPASTNLQRYDSPTEAPYIVRINNYQGPTRMELEDDKTERLKKMLCPCMALLTCLVVTGIGTIAILHKTNQRI